MFNLGKFISDSVTFRPVSMFAADIDANKEILTEEIKGKMVTRARLCRFACKEPAPRHFQPLAVTYSNENLKK